MDHIMESDNQTLKERTGMCSWYPSLSTVAPHLGSSSAALSCLLDISPSLYSILHTSQDILSKSRFDSIPLYKEWKAGFSFAGLCSSHVNYFKSSNLHSTQLCLHITLCRPPSSPPRWTLFHTKIVHSLHLNVSENILSFIPNSIVIHSLSWPPSSQMYT